MKFLIAVALTFFFIGCTQAKTVACDLSKSVSSLVSSQIATQLTCSNLAAVQADIDAQLAKLNVCAVPVAAAQVKPKTVVGDVVCGPLMDALSGGVMKAIPAGWGCTGGVLTDEIKTQLLAACQKAI